MGFLEGGKSDQLKYLEEERVKLWKRLSSLEAEFSNFKKLVEKRTPEAEAEAKSHSKMASEYRNKVEKRLNEANELLEKIIKQLDLSIEKREEIEKENTDIKTHITSISESISLINETEKKLNDKIEFINLKIKNVDNIFEKYPDLDDELKNLENLIEEIDENKEKSDITLSEVNKRKKEIDNLYREIFGYTQKNDKTGEEIKIEGKKEELDNSYEILFDQLEEAENKIKTINDEYKNKYKGFEDQYKQKYTSIINEISSLLPNALTAGLSSAFSKKKEDEESASIKLQRKFNLGIYFLIGISIIPLAISVYFIVKNIELLEVINRVPKIVLAIIPMYIPALWFTISASKKLNLSKRLIEEYSHKEVLSRTYEGLSTQISNIQDSEQSEELRFRLLTNFLQVTSENPGKLISNYNTSDHPVMEALEQSYKFQLAIDKLDSIPGLGKVAAILEKKAKRKLDEKAKKLDEGILKENTEE
ncbi:hypothetical protein [Algoriphagus formosus]|uniref:hypothetical protein n=1 Tax=Algoriphagus formosus TaxID=2007308 RepID=UPI003F708D44